MDKVISTTCTRCRRNLLHCDCDKPKPKRKPIDGVLPLTKEEKDELENILGFPFSEIYYDGGLHTKNKYSGWGVILKVKAILHLANLFDLEG